MANRPIVNVHRCALVDHHGTVTLAAQLLARWLKDAPPLSLAHDLELIAQSEQVVADLRLALRQCRRSHERAATMVPKRKSIYRTAGPRT